MLGVIIIIIIFIYFADKYGLRKKDPTGVEMLREQGFLITKKVVCENLGVGMGTSRMLCLDEDDEKFAIAPSGRNLGYAFVYDYKDLISFELVEDGKVIMNDDGNFFQEKNKVLTLMLNIKVNDEKIPEHKVVFLSQEVSKDGKAYTRILSLAEEAVRMLKTVKRTVQQDVKNEQD